MRLTPGCPTYPRIIRSLSLSRMEYRGSFTVLHIGVSCECHSTQCHGAEKVLKDCLQCSELMFNFSIKTKLFLKLMANKYELVSTLKYK